MLTLLFTCLLGGSIGLQAKTTGNDWKKNCKIIHQPSVEHPYITIEMIYYDWTRSSNSFFTHEKRWVPKDGGGYVERAGPAIYVDNVYVGSADDELAWPGGDGTGNGNGASGATSEDGWYGSFYTKSSDGVKYTVGFYDPRSAGNDIYKMRMCVYIDKLGVGSHHTVEIRGYWKVNGDQTYSIEHVMETEAVESPWGTKKPTATMTDFNHLSLSGPLNENYGPTTVGILSKNDGEVSLSKGYVQASNLDVQKRNNKGDKSFSDLTDTHNRELSKQKDGSKVAVEYILPLKPDNIDVTIYQWYNVDVPGFVLPKNLSITTSNTSVWDKKIKLTWEADESGGRSKEGEWNVYRDGDLKTTTKLGYSNMSYEDKLEEYDPTKYSYTVKFVPMGTPSGTDPDLSATLTGVSLKRDWSLGDIDLALIDDNSHISVTCNFANIHDAGTKTYKMKLSRSGDGGNTYTVVHEEDIYNSSTTSFTYTDKEGLVAEHTYQYKVEVNVMEYNYSKVSVPITLGGSTLTAFTASRGSYSNMVELSWSVKQIGEQETHFVLYRRPFGFKQEKEWTKIYSTSGTATTYSYDDNKALPGSFNEYKVSIMGVDEHNNESAKASMITDGFTYSTGVVSGRITYGTGTAVDSVKVVLKQQNGDGDVTSAGMNSLQFVSEGTLFQYKTDTTEIHNLYRGDFSVQMWVRPDYSKMSTTNTNYFLFDTYNILSIYLKCKGDSTYEVVPWLQGNRNSGIHIPADKWSHITLSYSRGNNLLRIVVTLPDGTKKTVSVKDVVFQWTTKALSATDFRFGVGTNGYFGYLDEFRFFTKALTDGDIDRNYNHPLAGTEEGLAIYYPFDEGLEVQSIAYDYSKTNGISNGRHAVSKIAGYSSTVVPSEDQLCLMNYTDKEGNYTVRGLSYVGEGTSYSIIPKKGIHEFSPSAQTRFISAQSLVHNGVNFEDISSFPVSGHVYYANTDYPVKGCNLYVDGVICTKEGQAIETDAEGKFTISVPIGDHFITVKKNGHEFVNGGRYPEDPTGNGERETFNKAVPNLDFFDATLVNFTGRVVGGDIEGDKPVGFGMSKNNIGKAKLSLMPTNSYRLNIVKESLDGSVRWKDNPDILEMESAKPTVIKSHSWRGANDNCNQLFIETDPVTGEFSAMVPPLVYTLQSILVEKANLTVISEPMSIDMTNPLIVLSDSIENENGGYDKYEYNTLLRQTYHSPPTFIVTQQSDKPKGNVEQAPFGISEYTIKDEDGELSITDFYKNGAYTYNYPIFKELDTYVFEMEGYELYENKDEEPIITTKVPLAGNIVTISNALSSEQGVYGENDEGIEPGSTGDLSENELELDENGRAIYKWKAGLPNITSPHWRNINIYYKIGDVKYDWSGNPLRGIVLGALPTGNNFVTNGPDLLDMILRDPPGTGSSAEWSKGTVSSTTKASGGTWSSDNSLVTLSHLGATVSVATGHTFFYHITDVETKVDLTVGVDVTCEGEDIYSVTREVTATKAITTSDSPDFVGAEGDVFIGTSSNLIFGNARTLDFFRDDKDPTKAGLQVKDAITTGLSFTTEFSYTQKYIENSLIPNFEKIRNSKLRHVSSVDGYVNHDNEAVYVTTLSEDDPRFGSSNHDTGVWGSQATKGVCPQGPSYTMFKPANAKEEDWATDSVEWCNNQIRIWKSYLALNENEKVNAYKERKKDTRNLSFDAGSSVTQSMEKTETNTNTYDVTTTASVIVGAKTGFKTLGTGVEYELQTQTGAGEHKTNEYTDATSESFSYTLAEEGNDALTVDVYDYGSFGPIFRTRGGQTSAPYEGEVSTKYYEPGTTIMEATMQIEVPTLAVDNPIMNDVPTGTAANYVLRLGNESEIGEDVVYSLFVLDETNANGAQLSIDGKVLTNGRLIKVPAGQMLTKALQLRQTDMSVLDYDSIAVVLASESQPDEIYSLVYISAHFVPSSSPVTLALSNTTMNTKTGDVLTLTFKDYDRNYKNLKAFRLQYKKQGATDWTMCHEYVLDEKDLGTNSEMLPTSGGSISYKLPMESFPDGNYLFRVESVSTHGIGEVKYESNEIALVKDMQRPRPLGLPEPSDGVLDIGDEISVTFNETILQGEITPLKNFYITGVLNGAEVAHETAFSTDGATPQSPAAKTEASINLSNKDFSFDAWVHVDGAGILLSHGKGANKLTVGSDKDGKLVVTFGDKSFSSSNSIPMGKWAFLTLNMKADGKLSAHVADEIVDYDLFSEEQVGVYEGNGPLSVGCGINAAIHELLLWDEAHDMTIALSNRSKTKSPSTRHLIGYWKMDEGEGTSIRDYARNRHMTMSGETWRIENENKAVSLDGNHYVNINTSMLPITTADDYAVELWMRGDVQAGEAQLLQMGEVALWLDSDGTLQLTGKDAYLPDAATAMAVNSGKLTDNKWHHVALNVLRQGAAAVYVDGVRGLTANVADVGSINSSNLLLGARRAVVSVTTTSPDDPSVEYTSEVHQYDRPFKGVVDEVRVWNASMSGELLTSNRKVRLTGRENGLVAYYPFEVREVDTYGQLVANNNPYDLCGSELMAQLQTLNSSSGQSLVYTDNAPTLRTKPTLQNVNFNYVTTDNKIVIELDEEPSTIDGCILNFNVFGVLDVNGNSSVDAIWTAFVNQNELEWSEDVLSLEKEVKTEESITATIVNKGGQQQMWTLTGMPSWLTANMEYGTTNPRSETEITFTVSEATPIGKYEETVYLKGNNGIETPLTLNINVTGAVPEWSVNPKDFEFSMNIIGRVEIKNIPMDDEDDIVAAFIGEECRGVAHPMYMERYDGNFITMDIYGNNEAGEEVTFRAYDASTGTLYPVVTPDRDITFEPLALIGKYDKPVVFTVEDLIEQQTELKKGWNWLSLYVITDDMTVPGIFEKIADNVLNVKSQSDGWLTNEEGVWGGNLGTLYNEKMYAVQLDANRTLRIVGKPVDPDKAPITVGTGWNWIGYYGRQVSSVSNALAGLQPEDSDILKGQSGITYFDDYEWAGTLNMMEPGVGYMLKSVTEGDRLFSYPTSALSGPSLVMKRANAAPGAEENSIFKPVNFRNYANNAIMAVRVVAGGRALGHVELGVFVDEECRTASVTNDEGMAYLTIPGDDEAMLSFKVAIGDVVVDANTTITFEVDGVYGSPKHPIIIDLSELTGIWEILGDSRDASVYDLQGRKIRLDGNSQRLSKGVYIINGQKKTVK